MTPTGQRQAEPQEPSGDRYATLRLIDWWDQQRLASARVMVVGAGALGNEVLKLLALLGVGTIVLVDRDVIELANLTRAVFFRPGDAGRPKVDVVAERVRDLNPDVTVLPLHGDVTRDVGLGLFRRMDVVIGCLDNRSARLGVNRACWRVSRPWVDGALKVLDGLVRVFQPGEGACYECTFTAQDYAVVNLRYSCPTAATTPVGRIPTTPTAASIIAAMQVQEALKLLHQLPVVAGRGVYYSGQSLQTTAVTYPVREDCPAHERYEPIVELPCRVEELTAKSFLRVVQARFPGQAMLALDRPLVSWLYCNACDSTETVQRPYDDVVPSRVPCLRCGRLRTFDIVHSLCDDGENASHPLCQLGIPPLHILPVRTSAGWVAFELAGDEPAALRYRVPSVGGGGS